MNGSAIMTLPLQYSQLCEVKQNKKQFISGFGKTIDRVDFWFLEEFHCHSFKPV